MGNELPMLRDFAPRNDNWGRSVDPLRLHGCAVGLVLGGGEFFRCML